MENKAYWRSLFTWVSMPYHFAILPIFIIVCGLLEAFHATESYGAVAYDFTIVATNGQAGITGIIGAPSINDLGYCVFPVTVSNGESMYFGNGQGNPIDINPSIVSSTRTFSTFLNINDNNMVVAQDTVSGSPPFYLIRAWNANIPGTWQLITEGQGGKSALVPWMNNEGQIAYLGNDGSNFHIYTTNSSGQQFYYQSNLLNNIFRPVIANNGAIVGKVGSSPSAGSIRVYGSNLVTFVDVAVASSGQFTSLDSLPGISQDGQNIAFYGINAGEPGIFIETANNGSFSPSQPYEIAGTANGFSSFQTFSHVAVKTLPGGSGIGKIAYVGTANGVVGLYSSEFQSKGATTPPIASTPSLVVAQGQSIPNLSGTVQSVSIQDPLNTNGQVAFSLQMSTGLQAIIVATPLVAGVDVSHFNNDSTNGGVIDFQTAANNGLSFVFVQDTQGTTFTSAYDAQNIQGATAAGLLVAPYHLMGKTIGGQLVPQDPTAEATFFLNNASGYIRNGYLPPILDVEAKFDGSETGYAQLTGMTLFQWVSTWLQFIQKNTGVAPIVYAPYKVLPLLQSITNSYPLWIASEDNDPTGVPTAGTGEEWPQWMFKQYASDLSVEAGHWPGIPDTSGNMGVKAVDLDSFNGPYSEQLAQMTNYPSFFKITGVNWTPFQGPNAGSFNFQVFSASASSVSVSTSTDLAHWSTPVTVPIGQNRVGVFLDSAASSQARFYSITPQ